MAKKFLYSWKEVFVIVAICGISLVILFYDGSPRWLRGIVIVLATVGPFLPILALIPWYFVARHQGLMSRSRTPCAVSCSNGLLLIECGNKRMSHPFERIVRARMAQNDNWTESNMLEDALGLFAANGREIVRIPESAVGLSSVVAELGARGIPIEYVAVSAPAVLD
jgi:hypothetical protein